MEGRFYAYGRLRFSLAPRCVFLRNNWQYVGESPGQNGSQFLLGELEQRTVAATARVDMAVSNALTLQLYAEPFVSVGRYAGWKEIANARAGVASDRFRPAAGPTELGLADPSFAIANLNANLVARWEFRPGSTVFLVWSHRGAFSGAGPDTLGSSAEALWRPGLANNVDVLLLKLNWWMNV